MGWKRPGATYAPPVNLFSFSMSVKSVEYRPDLCLRCGGATGPEASPGDVVKVYLNPGRSESYPEFIEGLISSVGQVSLADTSRIYTIQYESNDLNGPSSIAECDILSVLCSSCCELLDEHLTALLDASGPFVNISYSWDDDFLLGATLTVSARSNTPDVTIDGYEWYEGAVVTPLKQIGTGTTSTHLIAASSASEFTGGIYTAVVTDSAGNTTVARTYVSTDDRLYELDKLRKAELSENAASAIDRCVENLTGTLAEKQIFSTQDHATPIYVRSGNCWANGLDLTGISPWNSGNSNLWAGTLITPCHIVMANHAYVVTGATIRFITDDGTVVTRTVMNSAQVGATDIRIGVLDSNVPDTITPVKVLPVDFKDWISLVGLPVLYFDQEEKALVGEIASISEEICVIRDPLVATRHAFYETVISGDSGNPVFLVNGCELVLLFCFTSPTSGPVLHDEYRAAVEQVIDDLGVCPPLLTADLSDATFNATVRWCNVQDRPFAETNASGVSLGQCAMAQPVSAVKNVAIGKYALMSCTTGDNNVAVGENAGDSATTGSDNVLVGQGADLLAATDSNTIAIGKGTIGRGSNTATYGNGSTVDHYFYGNLGVGITPTAKLHVAGTVIATGITQLTAGTASSSTTTGTLVVTGGVGVSGALFLGGSLTFSDAQNIVVNATTGTKIATATTQKLGFWNATPVVQPAAVTKYTVTYTLGSAPAAANLTVANSATPTLQELLSYCAFLHSQLNDVTDKLKTIGLNA